MISIRSYNKSEDTILMSEINKDDSLLIIGKGETEYKLNDFSHPRSYYDMKRLYGNCDLTDAYLDAEKMGAKNIFIMNCYKTSDFIECVDFAKYYNFAFIAPIGIKLSDTFYDSSENRNIYYGEYYLNEFSKFTNSTIILTDEHASLYENIDHYLQDMKTKVGEFKENCMYSLENNGRNIAFCLNHLKDRKFANVVLAARLASTKIGSYPDCSLNEVHFDIDNHDIDNTSDIIYFKESIHMDTSIENLKNFRTVHDPNKLIAIDRVIKHIERTLNTSFVLGKLYGQYIEMMLHDYIDMFLRALLNTMIKNYTINSIQFIKDKNMSGYMTVDFDVYPINSLESINILYEVR